MSMALRDVIFDCRFYNNLAELVLPDQRFLDTLRSLMVLGILAETDYGVHFVKAGMMVIAQDVLLKLCPCFQP